MTRDTNKNFHFSCEFCKRLNQPPPSYSKLDLEETEPPPAYNEEMDRQVKMIKKKLKYDQ